jgi:hypothetical protein
MAGDWTDKNAIDSERVKKAISFGDRMAAIVNGTSDQSFEEALAPLVNPDRFRRRGNERTEWDWPAYIGMLGQWNQADGKYEKTLHRASEVGNVVYLDLDERSTHHDGTVSALRSISIYEFDEADKIVGVDVIMGFHNAAPIG